MGISMILNDKSEAIFWENGQKIEVSDLTHQTAVRESSMAGWKAVDDGQAGPGPDKGHGGGGDGDDGGYQACQECRYASRSIEQVGGRPDQVCPSSPW